MSSCITCDADPSALTIEQALHRILQSLPRLQESETLACEQAKGRVCASDVLSPMSVPSFRASAMDGYAVRAAECRQPLRVADQSMAGHPGPDRLAPGTCQRITTGARVPDDADAVVPQENVDRQADIITVRSMPVAGLHVRLPGSDSSRNSLLIEKGCVLGAAELALLAAHGMTELDVYRKLRIALLSTGDELIDPAPAASPGAGQIFDANRPLLRTLFQSARVELIDLGICRDTESELEDALAAAADADVIISSGGVSVGDADHVRTVLERCGKVDLWKIAMKPGRPLTFGFSRPGQAYFGLPGNPVSAAITSLIFVRPAILHCTGAIATVPPPLQLTLSDVLKKNPGRVEFQRAVMRRKDDGSWEVGTTGLQDSHVLSSLHKANCLIELGVESTGAAVGEKVTVYPFTHFSDTIL